LGREEINRYRNGLDANGLGDCKTMAAKSAMWEFAVAIYPNSNFVIVAIPLREERAAKAAMAAKTTFAAAWP
jgi:hypothetical protein